MPAMTVGDLRNLLSDIPDDAWLGVVSHDGQFSMEVSSEWFSMRLFPGSETFVRMLDGSELQIGGATQVVFFQLKHPLPAKLCGRE